MGARGLLEPLFISGRAPQPLGGGCRKISPGFMGTNVQFWPAGVYNGRTLGLLLRIGAGSAGGWLRPAEGFDLKIVILH